jgi:uncharacterized protein with HEPN domain
MRNRYSEVPWKVMAGTRDKLVHEYFGVNLQVLWKAIKEDIPPVKHSINQLLKKIDKKSKT